MVRKFHICTCLVVITTLLLVTNYIFRDKNVVYSTQINLAKKHEVQLLFSYYNLETLLCREKLDWNLTRLYHTDNYENCPKKGITSLLFINGRTGKILNCSG